MNDKRSPNRTVLPAVWHGAMTLWKELMDESTASPNALSANEMKRMVAEYEFARARFAPSGKSSEPEAPQPPGRSK